jgi:hypothetical protein
MKSVIGTPSDLCCIYSLHSKHQRRKHTKKRKRKSSDQLRQLQVEYAKHPEWTKELMSEIAGITGLSEAQVYKWGWDQKKKIPFKTHEPAQSAPTLADLFSESAAQLLEVQAVASGPAMKSMLCFEVLSPLRLDVELYSVQKAYRISMESFSRERAQIAESRSFLRCGVVCDN